jgi:aryl-alcohol dehydrogenase-like predicted oxidoreductase
LESIPRKSYYLATKVGRTPDCAFDYSKENTLTSVENSLKKLKVDYIDVIQVRNEL